MLPNAARQDQDALGEARPATAFAASGFGSDVPA